MSEFSALLVSDLILILCSTIFSHPLYSPTSYLLPLLLWMLGMLEAYKIVFESPSNLEITVKNYPREAKDDHFDKDLDEKSPQITQPETNQVKSVVKIFEDFLQEKEGVENNSWKKTDKQVKSSRVKSDKGEVQKQESMIPSTGSKAMCNKTSDPKAVTKSKDRVTENGGDYYYKSMSQTNIKQ
ncbi:hypothetical protein GQ457_15G015180 [Hibiscus cannabinus]